MIRHEKITRAQLQDLIKQGRIQFAGNSRLKIFGRLTCTTGKRMLKSHRVFFADENEARMLGFRPCCHCMRKEFNAWLKAK